MGIVFQFICSISIPITTGSLFLIVVYNFLFQRAIVEWQQISQNQILNIEKQRLHNYAYLDKVITEIQYQQLSSDVTSLYSMFNKINQGKVRINQNYKRQIECHVGLFEQNLCSNPLVYSKFKENPNYLNLWYHRYITKFEDLSQSEQKNQIDNDIFSFYTKAIAYSSRKQLLHVTFGYNGYETSQMISFPAQKFNLQNISQLPNCTNVGLYNYDPRCRLWYQESLQSKGQVFTIPYRFAFTGVIGMTIAQRFNNNITNQFLSVLGLDYDLENLIENIFKPQDLYTNNSLFQGYTVFFHPLNNTVNFYLIQILIRLLEFQFISNLNNIRSFFIKIGTILIAFQQLGKIWNTDSIYLLAPNCIHKNRISQNNQITQRNTANKIQIVHMIVPTQIQILTSFNFRKDTKIILQQFILQS
ncbi:hypothetical protein ABPG74_009513 [Tetrahymena malaccensis]